MSDTSGNTTISDILTNDTFVYMLIFLACYSVIYLVLGVLYGGSSENGGPLRIARIIDIVILIIIIIYFLSAYANTSFKTIGDQFSDSLSSFKEFADNPYSIFTVVLFLLSLYTVVYAVNIPMSASTKPISIMIIELLTLLLFVWLLFVDFFKYVLNVDLLDFFFDSLIKGVRSATPTPTTPVQQVIQNIPKSTPASTCSGQTPPPEGEVFNIRNNLYTYDEAREVCSIYGAKLATYDQIEDAYNKGAEWCNYGWSEGQMALFPTQKTTWNELQKGIKPCSKNGTSTANMSCGRPGINGGIIKNPKIRFGVNCYGKKPAPSESEKALMKANVERKRPESKEDADLKAKLNVCKQHANKYLLVNSFNKTKWGEDT
jgi:hypothetical protein